MSRLVISLSGEGRGHASRVMTLLDLLHFQMTSIGSSRIETLLLCPANLLAFLQQTLRGRSVRLHPLPSMRFQYGKLGKLSYLRSLAGATPFALTLHKTIAKLRRVVEDFRPELAICDFEPLLPRVSARLGLKCLSLDHQHFLSAIDPKALPLDLRLKLMLLRPSVKLFCPNADRYLVSSFYEFPQRSGTEHFRQIGILLRSELACGRSQQGDFILAYLRRGPSNRWIDRLASMPQAIKVYGSERTGSLGNLHFQPLSNHKFLQDLLSCKCLITTAGNQLIGEALAIGKPVLAVPEPGNVEQQLNAHFLHESGLGVSLPPNKVSVSSVSAFLEQMDDLSPVIKRYKAIGNRKVLSEVLELLGETGRQESAMPKDILQPPQSKGIAI